MTRKEQIKRKAAGVGILWRDTLVCEGLDRDVAETIASAIQKESIHTAEWADKTMLEKVCQWLDENMEDYTEYYDFDTDDYDDKDNLHFAVASNHDYKKDFIEAFRKAMEEQQ